MRHAVSAVAICAALLGPLAIAGPAAAEAPRLNTEQFLRAASCVTYANLPQLRGDGFDIADLSETVAAQTVDKSDDMKRSAAREAARANRAGLVAGADPARIEQLRARRDRLCTPFMATATVAER